MISIQTLGSSSAGNAYRLQSGGRSLLLECGLPWKKIKEGLNFETSNLDGCLVTHSHGDHCKAAGDLMKAGIDLYATREAFAEMSVKSHFHRFHPIGPSEFLKGPAICFGIASFWGVTAFGTEHDAPGSVGFIIAALGSKDRVLFLTDTAYCRYNFPDRFTAIMVEANFSESILQHNVDAGLIDAGRAKRVRENHMSIGRVLDFLKANDLSRCRAIHLIHGSDSCSNSELFKRMVQEATGIPTFVEG